MSDTQTNVVTLMRLVDQYKRDNEMLKQAYQKLKSDNDSLKQENSDLKQQAETAVQAKTSLERECESLYQSWQDHLRTQAQQFEEIQKNMVPTRELEMFKVQVAEELEIPHRAKIDELTADITKYRDLYLRSHRDYELLKTIHETYIQDMNKQLTSIQTMWEQRQEEWQTKNKTLQELVEDTSISDRLRQVERENAELLVRQKQLLTEMDELRRSKEMALVDLQSSQIQQLRLNKEMETRVLVAEREVQAQQKRCEEMNEETEREKRELAKMHERVLVQEQAQLTFNDQLATKQREITHLRETYERRAAELRRTEEEKRIQLTVQLEECTKRLLDIQRSRDEAIRDSNTAARNHAKEIATLREEESKRVMEFEKQKADLIHQLSQLQRQHTDQIASEAATQQTLTTQLETLRLAHENLRREYEQQNIDLKQAKMEVQNIREEFSHKFNEYSEVEREYGILQAKHRAMMEKEDSARQTQDKLTAELTSLRHEQHTMISEMEEERKAHVIQITTLQQEWNRERNGLKKQITQLELELGKTGTDSFHHLTKLKKEKAHYKKLATGLKRKLADVMRDLAQVRRDSTMSLQAKSFETENLNRQVLELEKQRNEWRARMAFGQGSALSILPSNLHPTHPHTISSSSHAPLPTSTDTDLLQAETRTQQTLDELRARVETASRQRMGAT